MEMTPREYKCYRKASLSLLLLLLSLCDSASCQEASTAAPYTVIYIRSSGYAGFSNGSTSLNGSGTSLQLRFRACSSDGLLLYAEDSSRMAYFAVGLFQRKLLVESRNNAGTISDFSSLGSQLLSGLWYTVEFLGLGLGGTQLSLSINGEVVSISNSRFPAINFNDFNGLLYIGGHPSLATVGATHLRHSIDVCIEFVSSGSRQLDLLAGDISSTTDIISGCPGNQCLATGTALTFQGPESYLEFTIDNSTRPVRSYINIQLEFQTRARNGLFTYIGERSLPGVPVGSDFILLGLLNGSVYLEFNNVGGLHSLSTISTSSRLYNDGELHQLNFTFNRGQFRLLVDNADNSPPSNELVGTSILHPPTLWLGGVPIPPTSLPHDVPSGVFISLSGCLFNVSYTHTITETPSLLTAEDSVTNMSVTLDMCAPERTCSSNCSTTAAEVCYFECVCAPGFERDQTTNRCMDINECHAQPCFNGATCTNLINNYACTCATGFKGRNCEQINNCTLNPCQNRATCVDLVDDYQCSCLPGFTGRHCETDIPECSLFMPCSNGGFCQESLAGGGYECFCVSGWTGVNCDESVDDCAGQPCLYGGTCTDGFRDYTCNCTVGYEGKSCEIDIDSCLSDPCHNGGVCYDLIDGLFFCSCPNGYFGPQCEGQTCESEPCQENSTVECNPPEEGRGFQCVCRSGFSGDRCEINNCQVNPCHNNATCINLTNTISCSCTPGYTGLLCEENIDECSPSPCRNNATCVDAINNFYCSCLPGYTGEVCEEELNECEINPCESNGTCFDLIGDFMCMCQPGYTGKQCSVNVNEQCVLNPCQNNATCIDLFNAFSCDCVPGYTGEICDVNINDCAPNPCQNNATCRDLIGGFVCSCISGYIGDLCETDINECEENPCQNNGTCVDLVDDFACLCPSGYTGPLCTVNIDECDPNACLNNATCIDLVANFSCECLPGFTGSVCDIEMNKCEPNFCQNNGTCTELVNTFMCECQPGYSGSLCEEEINECLENSCQNNATCIDLIADFRCDCIAGYTGVLCEIQLDPCETTICQNGATCQPISPLVAECQCLPGYTGPSCAVYVDINECSPDSSADQCVNGSCLNTMGFFTCVCLPGYTGPLCEVEINECLSNPCLNDAICVDKINTFVCECPPGYSGEHCEVDCIVCNKPNFCPNCLCACLWNGSQCINNCTMESCLNKEACLIVTSTNIPTFALSLWVIVVITVGTLLTVASISCIIVIALAEYRRRRPKPVYVPDGQIYEEPRAVYVPNGRINEEIYLNPIRRQFPDNF